MEPYRCIECIAKVMRPTGIVRQTRSLASRPRNHIITAHNARQTTRSFASSSPHHAGNNIPKPVATPYAPTPGDNSSLSQLYDDAAASAGNAVKSAPARSQSATSTLSSLDSLIESGSKKTSNKSMLGMTPNFELLDLIVGAQSLNKPQELKLEKAPFRLGPTLGRTINLDGRDLGTALRRLNSLCSANNIRGDFKAQRFHERPGLKRKRLKSERWRSRFKEGFREMVTRVGAMRRMGW